MKNMLSKSSSPQLVNTVLGPLSHLVFGITDAHNHLWISALDGLLSGNPVLDCPEEIKLELEEYKQAGGSTILDCQPPGCGRDANKLAELSVSSGVNIIACTGFHRRKYYAPECDLWNASSEGWADLLIDELVSGMQETRKQTSSIKPGFVKIALEASLQDTPQAALEGAANAVSQTGVMIEVHTEKGAAAEDVLYYFDRKGVLPGQIVLCHMDKRVDLGLQTELAKAGILLEYDTFFRPKYKPEENVWKLVEQMVTAGFSYRIAFATDMAESVMYHHIGGGPGLASLPVTLRDRLTKMHIPENNIQQMLGENIARRLAGLN